VTKPRSLFAAVGLVVSSLLLSACGWLSSGQNPPELSDATAPANVTAALTTTAPPACQILGNDKRQLVLIGAFAGLKDPVNVSDQPALDSNPHHYAPQYRCTYNPKSDPDNQGVQFVIATSSEKPNSHVVFDYIVQRWANQDLVADYLAVNRVKTVLDAERRNLLQRVHAKAYLDSENYLVGVAFQCHSVTVVDKLLVDINQSAASDSFNQAIVARLNPLLFAELKALKCK
jgi:uncharacterized lipoprotein YajG